ncbi:hypothetical protein [Alkalibacillus salilacus]|uniref:Uncharacterized protein n=1 Tax=Alkalibacillus salilacus TaxID=284582 RepID=A0ABT9VF48_9BACI|nr:hypothetical protein [Alkalibacillus salilacus]MDQ0159596.1 hypothetical protein [Alkalibacillus salilacus]
MTNMSELKKRIGELNNQTDRFVEEFKEYLQAHQTPDQQNPPFISYFTHSINAATDFQDENLLFGGFHIKNLSSATIEDLYICLRIDTSDPFNFSGKFNNDPSSINAQAILATWERFNHSDDDKEHWFKLGQGHYLKPFDDVSLSDFQITWENHVPFSCSITGFVYTESESDGKTSLNTINIRM